MKIINIQKIKDDYLKDNIPEWSVFLVSSTILLCLLGLYLTIDNIITSDSIVIKLINLALTPIMIRTTIALCCTLYYKTKAPPN